MRDSEVVASIVAGDPDGLAQAYDRYAESLYKYCRSVLSDPADAADAVRDTFVIAVARIGWLTRPQRLRAWLYAVARAECQRATRGTSAAPADSADVTADDGTAGAADGAQLRTLLADAAWGLNPAEREAFELQRHELEASEIAAVLGVSRKHAHALVSRAGDQLMDSLGALIVARTGQYECARLRDILTSWDWRLSVPLRKGLYRHIERCGTCAARRAFELRPAMLPGLPPGRALRAAASDGLRLAVGPPGDLRAATLALAADRTTPSAIAHRAVVLGPAGPLRPDGFPGRPRPPASPPPRYGESAGWHWSPHRRTTVEAGAMLAVAVVVVTIGLHSNPGFFILPGGRPPASTGAAAAAVAPTRGASYDVVPPSASTTAPAAPSPSAYAGPATPSASATPTRPTDRPTATWTTVPTPTIVSPSPTTVSRSPTASPSRTVTPSPTTAPTGTPTTPATSPPGSPPVTPSGSGSPKASPTATPAQSAGTLIVNPPDGDLSVLPGGVTISLAAQGGPVDWSIAVSGGEGHVAVDPSSGTLQPGATVIVTVKTSNSAGGRELTVDPGGTVLTIVTGRDSAAADSLSLIMRNALADFFGL